MAGHTSLRDTTVDDVAGLLSRRFPTAHTSRVVDIVREEYDAIALNPIRIYVPNLIEHSARKRLTEEQRA